MSFKVIIVVFVIFVALLLLYLVAIGTEEAHGQALEHLLFLPTAHMNHVTIVCSAGESCPWPPVR